MTATQAVKKPGLSDKVSLDPHFPSSSGQSLIQSRRTSKRKQLNSSDSPCSTSTSENQ